VRLVTAAEIARAHGLDPKRYRQALRDARLGWYIHGAPWTVEEGSPRHRDLLRVLDGLMNGKPQRAALPTREPATGAARANSDEAYVIALCDATLGRTAVRQHKFDFLRGDPTAQGGRGRMLPVDAWYPDLALVIEYRERQHSEAVGFFDRRLTCSGVPRGEQRRRYDLHRREILPLHGIGLVEFDYFEFRHAANRRLVRSDADRQIVLDKLRDFRA